ncbi:hypothetical protein [Cyclobacterium jeungdonense]|uniref:Uncharacterized protein n=1 Tax=Cyclobacterium jeungdonense TaxID=708087 RepID=A0ABT8C9V4_9BACT|nr:hypothetical protein [Cyclobacterium jeungdonense]MDN3689300.1 hypothetical protein [Cyclobacterium jeungdonense]
MKQLVYSILFVCLTHLSTAKEGPNKTFLIIFDENELELYQSSAKKMELSFLDAFKTKVYVGNSEHALFVTVPFSDWTVCEMGKSLVRLSDKSEIPLELVAFRIIDMNECQENFQALLSESNEQGSQKKVATIKLSL